MPRLRGLWAQLQLVELVEEMVVVPEWVFFQYCRGRGGEGKGVGNHSVEELSLLQDTPNPHRVTLRGAS